MATKGAKGGAVGKAAKAADEAGAVTSIVNSDEVQVVESVESRKRALEEGSMAGGGTPVKKINFAQFAKSPEKTSTPQKTSEKVGGSVLIAA